MVTYGPVGVDGAEQLDIWLQFWADVIVTVSFLAMFLIQVGLYVCNVIGSLANRKAG